MRKKRWKGITLKCGQLVSIAKLAEEIKLSQLTIELFLNLLYKKDMV